jgi:ubiquinone/menaquinone biosynthesis C-methylase UbiE
MKRARLVVLAGLLGLVALFMGLRFGAIQYAPAVHPLTGRQIAGIATDAAWLDRASRQQEEAPEAALTLVGIRPGMVVADVGAGSGYMTMRIARIVGRGGQSGKVYANDIQPAMLRIVQEKARAEGLSNIETVLGTETDARLPEGVIDLALLVDVYHEFRRPREMLRSIHRSLGSGGALVLIEYRKEDPDLPIALTHRMSVADATREVEAEGFRFDRAIEGLPRQHIIVFRK